MSPSVTHTRTYGGCIWVKTCCKFLLILSSKKLLFLLSEISFDFTLFGLVALKKKQRKGFLVISLGLLLANSWKAFKEWGQVFILYFIYFKRGWGAGSGMVHVGGKDVWRGKWGKVSREGFGTIVVVLGLVLQLKKINKKIGVALARVFLFLAPP